MSFLHSIKKEQPSDKILNNNKLHFIFYFKKNEEEFSVTIFAVFGISIFTYTIYEN
ncbi:hypothetical protein FLJC2902T_13250 [Flavobacterium limnosediminis JC2902]|uniref:Uncharacterized protein n=1 Tax=Flavobacterium limnosediminis JC2902 TaxID=1341181 RepID=V6SQ38_9FLAO|nr:hypothetical protein FLJC2902T_13250 [Flavobacterium limnosediminis JC2902]